MITDLGKSTSWMELLSFSLSEQKFLLESAPYFLNLISLDQIFWISRYFAQLIF